jgi:hypothetical protein
MAKRVLDMEGASMSSKKSRFTSEEVAINAICKAVPSATVHGVVTTLSPIKESAKIRGGRKYFDGQVADEKGVVRLVGFEPKLWNTLHESCDKSKSVSLMNCVIQTNKRSGEFEVVANDRTKIQESPKKICVDRSLLKSSAGVEAATIKEMLKLAPGTHVSVTAKVTEVKPPEKLLRRDKSSYVTKQDCVVGDATGASRLVLWEDRIGGLQQNSSYKFVDLRVNSYNNSKYVSVGEQTEIIQTGDLGKVEETALEERKITGEICHVLQCEEYTSCTECYSKVRSIDAICGECTGCFTMVKLGKCATKFVVKVKVEDEAEDEHVITMFNNTLEKVVDTAGSAPGVVKRALMDLPKIVFTINSKNVAVEAVEKDQGTWRVKDGASNQSVNVAVEGVEKDQGTWRVKDCANDKPV